MKHEISCGAVITRTTKEGTTEVLLVAQHNGLTGFPKGHIEPGETEHQTATREALEETGLQIKIEPRSPRFEFSYIIPAGTRLGPTKTTTAPIHKTVVLLLATVEKGTEAPQPSEISTLLWVPATEVANHLTFPEWRQIWSQILPTLTSGRKTKNNL